MRWSRREALKRGLLGTAGMVLLKPDRFVAEPAPSRKVARAVIQIWMWGGPSHLDTFDPKPEAGYDYCGPLKDQIPTSVDGVFINGSLPLMAQQANKYTIIRSMTHGINSHETAAYVTQTGRQPGQLVFPGAGAVVSLLKGYDHGYAGLLPPYIVLTTPQGRFSESGFLGVRYKPFATGGDPKKDLFAVEGIVAEGLSDERQKARRILLRDLDTLGKALPSNGSFELFDRCQSAAYDMMFGEARRLFDLSQEGEEMRDRYGRNTFGQSCLMARRLVENGVPYVTINSKGWDTHKKHFEAMRQKLPEMDQGMAALLQDLSDRRLLEDTIVWWSGEFGRGPKIQWEPPWNGGRSHHGSCFSALLAGGGFQGGRVVGASDRHGMEVAERPVTPRDLLGSLYERLGIDPQGFLSTSRGLDVRVLDVAPEMGRDYHPLKEIMS